MPLHITRPKNIEAREEPPRQAEFDIAIEDCLILDTAPTKGRFVEGHTCFYEKRKDMQGTHVKV